MNRQRLCRWQVVMVVAGFVAVMGILGTIERQDQQEAPLMIQAHRSPQATDPTIEMFRAYRVEIHMAIVR